jgi:hypothetical protein
LRAYVCVPIADGSAMAATRNCRRALGKGTEKRKTARNGPAASVGYIRRRTTSPVRECACIGSARNDRASTRCWLVLVKVGGTAVAMAQRQQHVHVKGHKQGDGERGSAHDKGLCSPDSWPQKGRAFARRRRAQCVGVDGEPELGVRSSGQRYDTIAEQGSARGDDGSGTCKATGSARWPALKRRRVCAAARCGTVVITHKQRAHKARSILGSKAGSTSR